ncbi:MAG: hypothetical protein ACK40G_08715 [Cytophagaceae bacterium]
MMNKPYIKMVLLFILISVVSPDICKAYCAYVKEESAQSCCKKSQKKDDCCERMAQMELANPEFFKVTNEAVVLDIYLLLTEHLNDLDLEQLIVSGIGVYSYSPPILHRDIPVFNQVFRI